jgi:endonuclease YncB( thermonuclease family)
MRHLLAAAILLVPASAPAQSLSGTVRAVDGDTLVMTGTRIRLFGIDAPEAAQTCNRAGEAWACGTDASAVLAELVAGRQVSCIQRDRDDYGRAVATCAVGRIDLGAAMVGAGYAIAYRRYSDAYLADETRARALGIGLWASQFDDPAAWRIAHGDTPPERRAASEPREDPGAWGASTSGPAAVYYRNCSEARAAGAAPLRRGEPGYRPQMDGDNDGVACEPYRGRG